jgi:hypothetical protein
MGVDDMRQLQASFSAVAVIRLLATSIATALPRDNRRDRQYHRPFAIGRAGTVSTAGAKNVARDLRLY